MLKISVMDTSGVVVQGLLQASTWLPILDLSDQKKDIRSRLALWKVSGCLNKPILTKGATRRNLHTLLQFPNWQICCTSSLSRSWLLRDSSIWFSTKPSEAWLRLQLQDGLGRGDCCQAAGPKQIQFTNNLLVTDLRTWIYGFGAGLGGSTPCEQLPAGMAIVASPSHLTRGCFWAWPGSAQQPAPWTETEQALPGPAWETTTTVHRNPWWHHPGLQHMALPKRCFFSSPAQLQAHTQHWEHGEMLHTFLKIWLKQAFVLLFCNELDLESNTKFWWL